MLPHKDLFHPAELNVDPTVRRSQSSLTPPDTQLVGLHVFPFVSVKTPNWHQILHTNVLSTFLLNVTSYSDILIRLENIAFNSCMVFSHMNLPKFTYHPLWQHSQILASGALRKHCSHEHPSLHTAVW